MTRARLLLAAAVAAASFGAAAPASACTGTVCDTINYICSLGDPHGGCLP